VHVCSAATQVACKERLLSQWLFPQADGEAVVLLLAKNAMQELYESLHLPCHLSHSTCATARNKCSHLTAASVLLRTTIGEDGASPGFPHPLLSHGNVPLAALTMEVHLRQPEHGIGISFTSILQLTHSSTQLHIYRRCLMPDVVLTRGIIVRKEYAASRLSSTAECNMAHKLKRQQQAANVKQLDDFNALPIICMLHCG